MQAYIDKVWDVDLKNWTRGDALYLQAKGAARAWVCRDCTVKSIVVFPDNGQALDFYFDWKALFGEEEIIYLQELPLSSDKVGHSALWVNRGESFRKWRDGDIKKLLITTPGSLMTPLSFAEDSFSIMVGETIGRDNLARWLQNSGYEAVDLVWITGHFSVRGS
ncbi:MAG: transcription-repair coupling factor, partial [Acetomicrobium sp.]|nr:transcription-repair coupling factor [Acetomicrobium sp.]